MSGKLVVNHTCPFVNQYMIMLDLDLITCVKSWAFQPVKKNYMYRVGKIHKTKTKYENILKIIIIMENCMNKFGNNPENSTNVWYT